MAKVNHKAVSLETLHKQLCRGELSLLGLHWGQDHFIAETKKQNKEKSNKTKRPKQTRQHLAHMVLWQGCCNLETRI